MCCKDLLLNTLKDLCDGDFKEFKWYLQDHGIPKSQLDQADRLDTVDKIIQTCNQQSTEVMRVILRKMSRKDLVKKLSSSSRTGEEDGDTHDQNKRSSSEEVSLSAHVVKVSSCAPIQEERERVHQKEIRQTQEALKKHKAEMKNYVREEIQRLEEVESPMKEEARAALPDKLTAAGEADSDTLKSTSSEYNYITCKHLIHLGSPSVYQLLPKKQNIGTLKKMSLGQRDPNRINRTILLVGETGAGKSTLINALVNYAIGVKWEDDVWFEIVEEEKKTQSESQTSDVIVYEIFGFEDKTLPYSLTIIDTPGYGDTRGTEQDDKVSKRLLDLFRSNDGVYEMNAVGLVLKASENRLSNRLRYMFDSVVSLFGNDLEENIVTLITHSDGRTPREALKAIEKANIKCAKNEKYQPVHFLFNNCQNSERNEENSFALDVSWKITSTGMRKFTSFLQNRLPRNLKNTTEVLNSRITLTACIQNLQERVELIELKQKEIQQTHEALKKHEEEMESNKEDFKSAKKQQKVIQQTQEALKKHEEEMKNNQNFTVVVDEPYKVKERIGGGMWALMFYDGAVSCNICEENCHYPGCTMAWYPRDCEVMRRGHCTSCTNRCPVSAHVKEKMIYVTKTRKVQRTLQDVKQKYERSKADREKTSGLLENLEMAKVAKGDVKEKYERSKADCEKTSGLLEDLEKKMEALQKDKVQWLEEAFQHVVKLEQIALNTDSLSTHVHLDFLMEKMKECREKDKFETEVQKLEEMKSRENEGTKAVAQYRFGQVKAAGKSCFKQKK